MLLFFALVAQPMLLSQVLEAQQFDDETESFRSRISSGEVIEGWNFSPETGVCYRGRPFVPTSCCEEVLKEFHHSRLAVHPRGTKMYQDLCCQFWWKGMKRSVAEFVSNYLIC